MLTKNIAEMTAKIDAHRAADLLVRGSYYDAETGRGCFIGCLAHGNRPKVLAETYGIPEPLTRVLEGIFEALPDGDAADFFSAIPRAIGADRKDLGRVVWAFLAGVLRAMPLQLVEVQSVIDKVIAGMDLLAGGGDWKQADARDAADAAYATAYAASAGLPPRAAAHAAAAAYSHAALIAAAIIAASVASVAAYAAYAARNAAYAAHAAAAAYAAARKLHCDMILRLMADAPVMETSHADH